MLTVLLWAAGVILACFLLVVFRGAPYVPTRQRQLAQAFEELYPLNSSDTVVDVGSGDGIVLRTAARKGARAIGYELNPLLVLLSRWASRKYQKRVKVQWKDFWLQQLPAETTVVYAFLEGRDITKMERYLVKQAKDRKTPLHFISYGFELPTVVPVKRVGAMVLYRFE